MLNGRIYGGRRPFSQSSTNPFQGRRNNLQTSIPLVLSPTRSQSLSPPQLHDLLPHIYTVPAILQDGDDDDSVSVIVFAMSPPSQRHHYLLVGMAASAAVLPLTRSLPCEYTNERTSCAYTMVISVSGSLGSLVSHPLAHKTGHSKNIPTDYQCCRENLGIASQFPLYIMYIL